VSGERRVLNILDEGKDLLECFSNPNEERFDQTFLKFAWKEFKIKGVVITESPNIEGDALLLQKEFVKL
jgi:hypothetical protein